MSNLRLRIAIHAPSLAEANRLTTELETLLKQRVEGAIFARERSDPTTQDAGTILIAALSAPAAIAFMKGPAAELAKGIADWLRKRRAKISIGRDGSVAVDNVAPDDVERIIRDVLSAHQQRT
jgi:hypothetical protein